MSLNETCCFTGNRPHKLPWGGDESDPACRRFITDLQTELTRLIGLGFRHFICGMALGADTLFAEAVLKLKSEFPDITLEAAVPCPEQPDRWSEKDRKRYQNILEQCDTVTMVSARYTADCMMQRNRYMVDRAALVIAFSRAQRGGTTGTVRYAEKQGKATVKL